MVRGRTQRRQRPHVVPPPRRRSRLPVAGRRQRGSLQYRRVLSSRGVPRRPLGRPHLRDCLAARWTDPLSQGPRMARLPGPAETSDMTRPVLILGGSPWQLDLIRATKRLGLPALVADISPNAPGREVADDFVEVNTDDREALRRIARDKNVRLVFSDQADRVVGTIGWLNDRLDLPGISFATAQKFTDKYLMRQGLLDADVEMPRHAHVNSMDLALRAAESFGYPAVLKPKLSWASKGVHKVDDATQLRQAFPRTLAESKDGFILVEEFVAGMEVTVEGFSLDGAYYLLGISEKRHYDFNACVANRLAYPPRLPPDVLGRIEDRVRRVVT